MNKKAIEAKLNQIIRAANAMTVVGEQNAAQIVGICQAAREVWQIVNADTENEQRGEST